MLVLLFVKHDAAKRSTIETNPIRSILSWDETRFLLVIFYFLAS